MSRKTCVIYARKSSDETEKNASLESQVKACEQYAAMNDFEVLEIYRENYTGMKIDRPELSKIQKLVKANKIDAVIVYSSDRLTRNPSDADVLLRLFFKSNVELHIRSQGLIRDTPEAWLMWGIEAQFNKYWRDKIIDATTRGKREKMAAGLPVGSGKLPYGFIISGKGTAAELTTVPEQVEVIQRIFYLFTVKQMTVTEIADRFNADRVPTRAMQKKGFNKALGKWNPAMLYQILKNESYAGIFYANRMADNNKYKPREEWIEIPIERLVDEVTWNKAQELLSKGRTINGKRGQNEYLLSKRIKCLHCGSSVCGKPSSNKDSSGKAYTYLIYICPAARNRFFVRECHLPQFRTNLIDDKVWTFVRKLISNPRLVVEAYQEAQKQIDIDSADAIETVAAYKSLLDRHEGELQRYAEMYAEGDIPKALFKEKKATLDSRILETQQRIAEAESLLQSQRISDEQILNLERFCEDVSKRLAKDGDIDFRTKQQLLRDLAITAEIGIEDGRKVLYLFWSVYETRYVLDADKASGSGKSIPHMDSSYTPSESTLCTDKVIIKFKIDITESVQLCDFPSIIPVHLTERNHENEANGNAVHERR